MLLQQLTALMLESRSFSWHVDRRLTVLRREFIITGTKAGSKPATTDVKEEPATNGTKAAANGKSGLQCLSS